MKDFEPTRISPSGAAPAPAALSRSAPSATPPSAERGSARIRQPPGRAAAAERLGGEELGDERAGRPLGQVREGAVLDHAAGGQQGDGVAEARGLADVVGDQHHRLGQAREEPTELLLQLRAHDRIQRAERLVEQQDGRVQHERAHQPHPLALAPAELARIAPQHVAVEPGQLGQLAHPRRDPGARPALRLRGQRHVVEGGQVGIEPAVLHHVAHAGQEAVARAGLHRGAVHPHRARVRPDQAQDEPQHGGLARAARPQEHVGGAGAHLQGHRVEGRGGAEALRDLVDRDHPRILPEA